jgi:hypothetical protein
MPGDRGPRAKARARPHGVARRAASAWLMLAALAGSGACAGGAPAAPTAAGRPRSILEGLPGYDVPANPESLAMRRGRRDAPRVSIPFRDGRSDMPALLRAALAAIGGADEQSFRSLCITEREFSAILWPEMPESNPLSGATAGDAWYFLDHRLRGGIRGAIDDHGSRRLTYRGWLETRPRMAFRNFRLIRGVRIAVLDAQGVPDTLDFLRTVAVRHGVYKIYSMRD